MLAGMIVLLLIILVFVILAIILLQGKGSSLIAGFNTMSKEEKAKYDEVALCKFMGKLLLAIVFAMMFMLYDAIFEVGWGFAFGGLLIIILTIGGLVYMNTGNRFKK